MLPFVPLTSAGNSLRNVYVLIVSPSVTLYSVPYAFCNLYRTPGCVLLLAIHLNVTLRLLGVVSLFDVSGPLQFEGCSWFAFTATQC